jgi:antitoxin (DNA-binding transcriptional repressor) of toxin-antitoxin stability system
LRAQLRHNGGHTVKFVSVRDVRGRSAELRRELPQERETVITSNGRPVAILAAVGESNVEESLAAFRRARAVDAVGSIQARSDPSNHCWAAPLLQICLFELRRYSASWYTHLRPAAI